MAAAATTEKRQRCDDAGEKKEKLFLLVGCICVDHEKAEQRVSVHVMTEEQFNAEAECTIVLGTAKATSTGEARLYFCSFPPSLLPLYAWL